MTQIVFMYMYKCIMILKIISHPKILFWIILDLKLHIIDTLTNQNYKLSVAFSNYKG